MDSVRNAKDRAAETVDSALKETARAVVKATNAAVEFSEASRDRLEEFVDTGRAHWGVGEELALGYVRDAVRWIRENQELSYFGAFSTAMIVFPGPRRFLVRQLLRPFRSEEAMYRSAERRLENLKTNWGGYGKEGEKLQKRMEAAVEEFNRGQHKLKATSKQLSSFSRTLDKEIRGAETLLNDLRYMPSRPSLAMRSEVANKLADLKKQKRDAENNIYSILRKGI
ncbi:hypothetical protein BSKO_12946 [Bryopsis sp. KO-2023]|nr:hypothetical protein BSKO_12946 [Bryopsis sp. KO-2023]